jgi:glycosyltransferase involved in cell wall biosynthesis
LRLLYVSIQAPYKHHVELMQAVADLRMQGRSVVLQMVGGNPGAYGQEVLRKRIELDPDQSFLQELGHVDFDKLHELYKQADAFVFASSCENLPNILIEAMAAGLPIACSNRGPMPEVLSDAGVYFDPESPKSIAKAIAQLGDDPALRDLLALRAWQRAQVYSWERCARESFDFVAQVALQNVR